MFTRRNDRPKALPGVGRFAKCLADGKLWRKEEKAGERLIRKKHQLSVQPKADRSIKSRAAGESAGPENADANAAGDSDAPLRTKWTSAELEIVKDVTSLLLG